MATRETVLLVDDLDGTIVESGGQTVRVGLDDTWYDIDLSGDHAAALRAILEPYLAAGRKVPRTRLGQGRYGK